MKVLYNHIGYEPKGEKRIILESSVPLHDHPRAFLLDEAGRTAGMEGDMAFLGEVSGWKGRYYYDWLFSLPETGEGRYRLMIRSGSESVLTDSFEIRAGLFADLLIPDILTYFRSVRCSDEYDRQDRSIPITGNRDRRVDVRGGWYDASGDVSKYLSHLSYANYMNPQQTPAVVWLMSEGIDSLQQERPDLIGALEPYFIREILHGADFLMRMQAHEGYFYMTVFDQWSGDSSRRQICAYKTQKGELLESYQAGFRQGGGMAVAALARTAGLKRNGAFCSWEYLAAAEKGFAHLQEHNCTYLDDGQENIIDDYCALLAAVELYAATGSPDYLEAAEIRAGNLTSRLSEDENGSGWWRADDKGEMPYFHAVEAGLPVLALIRFAEIAGERIDLSRLKNAVTGSLRFELSVTGEVNNPFGYPRQYVKPVNGEKQKAFFFPHENLSGYWWQGENARLASLAMAARKGLSFFEDGSDRKALRVYSDNLLHWILGRNPFDLCMLTGRGRNNPEAEPGFLNFPGGVINGITSHPEEEQDIAFLPEPYGRDGMHRWRWCEQWIPHAAWLLGALCTGGEG